MAVRTWFSAPGRVRSALVLSPLIHLPNVDCSYGLVSKSAATLPTPPPLFRLEHPAAPASKAASSPASRPRSVLGILTASTPQVRQEARPAAERVRDVVVEQAPHVAPAGRVGQ